MTTSKTPADNLELLRSALADIGYCRNTTPLGEIQGCYTAYMLTNHPGHNANMPHDLKTIPEGKLSQALVQYLEQVEDAESVEEVPQPIVLGNSTEQQPQVAMSPDVTPLVVTPQVETEQHPVDATVEDQVAVDTEESYEDEEPQQSPETETEQDRSDFY